MEDEIEVAEVAKKDPVKKDEKFTIEGWNDDAGDGGNKQDAPGDDGQKKPGADFGAQQKKPLYDPNPDDDDEDNGGSAGGDDNGGDDNVLSKLLELDDNDFSLDDTDGAAAGGEGDATQKDNQTKDSGEVISRIAKEFEIGDVQDAEQLIDLLKKRLQAAETGADAPTAAIDQVMKLPKRDLVKQWLVKVKRMDDDLAEEFIEKNIEINGEEWLDTQTPEIYSNLRAHRKQIVEDHVKKAEARIKQEQHFTESVQEEVKNIKTMFGIPLKPFQSELREFQAMVRNSDEVNRMRNDPQLFVAAYFAQKFGAKILNTLLKDEGAKSYRKGHRISYKQNVEDKILNKSTSQQMVSAELPSSGTKKGTFNINDWNSGNDDDE